MGSITDAAATKQSIEDAFMATIKKIPASDTLIVYYAGHGGKDQSGEAFFAPYDASYELSNTSWSMSWIHAALEKEFRGRQVILTGDACYSGSLGEGSGFHTTKPYASLTSSLSSQPSTGNWTFTESLIAGFRGDSLIDANWDGNITLAELARYTSAEMAFADGQRSSFVTHEFNPDVIIARTNTSSKNQRGDRMEVEWNGNWYNAKIIDRGKGQFKVHYAGYDESADEWVSPDRIRPFAPQELPQGTEVEVAWSPTLIFDQSKAEWYPARVLKAEDGLHLIHYDGYSEVWDEWVSPTRIRRGESETEFWK